MAKVKISEDLEVKIINYSNSELKQKTICEKYSAFRRKTHHYKATARQDKLIANEFKKEPQMTSTEVQNVFAINISSRTVRRQAHEDGLGCFRPI